MRVRFLSIVQCLLLSGCATTTRLFHAEPLPFEQIAVVLQGSPNITAVNGTKVSMAPLAPWWRIELPPGRYEFQTTWRNSPFSFTTTVEAGRCYLTKVGDVHKDTDTGQLYGTCGQEFPCVDGPPPNHVVELFERHPFPYLRDVGAIAQSASANYHRR